MFSPFFIMINKWIVRIGAPGLILLVILGSFVVAHQRKSELLRLKELGWEYDGPVSCVAALKAAADNIESQEAAEEKVSQQNGGSVPFLTYAERYTTDEVVEFHAERLGCK